VKDRTDTRSYIAVALAGLAAGVHCGALGALPAAPPYPKPVALAPPPPPPSPPAASGSAASSASPPSDKATAAQRIEQWKAELPDSVEIETRTVGGFVIGFEATLSAPDGDPPEASPLAVATDAGIVKMPATPPGALQGCSLADIDGDGRQDLLLVWAPHLWTRRRVEISVYADRASGPQGLPVPVLQLPSNAEWSARLGRKVTLDIETCSSCETSPCLCDTPTVEILAWDGKEISLVTTAYEYALTNLVGVPEADRQCSSTPRKSSPWLAIDDEGKALASQCKCTEVSGIDGAFCCPWAPGEEGESTTTCRGTKPAGKKTAEKRAK